MGSAAGERIPAAGREDTAADGAAASSEPDEGRGRDDTPDLLLRRLDWRFLLDDPHLGRVACRGPDSGRLVAALRREAESVEELESPPRDEALRSGSGADLVVLRQPDAGDLEDARMSLRDGGRLYCEVDRPAGLAELVGRPGDPSRDVPAGALLPGDGTELLRASGFADVRLHLHYPDFDRCREIVPLCGPALSLALRRHLPWLPESMIRVGTGVGLRALPALAPCVSITARAAAPSATRPPGGGGADTDREAEGLPWAGLPHGRATRLAVTPRFRASRHVVVLVPDETGTRAESVVKVARDRRRSDSLDRETRNLRRLQEARDGGFDSVPRLQRAGRASGFPYLVETGLGGRPMNRSYVRRHPGSSIRSVTTWLVDVHRATARRGADPDALCRRLVDRPLDRVADGLDLDRGEQELVEETRRLTRPLTRFTWPTVFEHGDLSQPNLLVDRKRGIGVVDWELADPEGMPAADLFFFLAYVAFARHRAGDPEACVRAVDRTFFRPEPRVQEAVERYAGAVGLAPGVLPALFAASWPRQVAGLLARTADGGTGRDDPAGGRGDWVRSHRFFAVWRHTVDEFGRLHLGRGGRA